MQSTKMLQIETKTTKTHLDSELDRDDLSIDLDVLGPIQNLVPHRALHAVARHDHLGREVKYLVYHLLFQII